MAKSIKTARRGKSAKPPKPYNGFPLFPHASGRWAKKIRQRTHFFGRWGSKRGNRIVPVDDVQASAAVALEEFNRQWPFLSEGRTPPAVDTRDGCTLRTLCNAFLTSKLNKVAAGELSERAFRDYRQTTDLLIAQFGADRRADDLRPDDFEGLRKSLATRLGAVTLGNTINRCRVVFKFAWDSRLVNQPITYGQSFNRPSAKTLRKARNAAGPRMFERDELLLILDALAGKPVTVAGKAVTITPDPFMRAIVLLGCNCGFGNTDVARLPQSAVDLDGGWVNFPRPKTEIPRRIPLWPETAAAIRQALAERPEPKDPADSGLCFLTRTGKPWVRMQPKRGAPDRRVPIDPLAQRFARLLKLLGIHGRRGRGFYTLRHVFETIGGESRDQIAVNALMGHVDSSMAAVYREHISNDRLQAVTNVVHFWLFGM